MNIFSHDFASLMRKFALQLKKETNHNLDDLLKKILSFSDFT